MSDSRINQVSITVTGPRQTPPDFSKVLADVASKGVAIAGDLIGSVAGANPMLSAAVAGVKAVASLTQAKSPGGARSYKDEGGGGAADGAGGGGSDAMELMRMQQAMQAESNEMNAMYLQMQREMQRESREYTALTNIMKVRHDTAKSAINNVR